MSKQANAAEIARSVKTAKTTAAYAVRLFRGHRTIRCPIVQHSLAVSRNQSANVLLAMGIYPILTAGALGPRGSSGRQAMPEPRETMRRIGVSVLRCGDTRLDGQRHLDETMPSRSAYSARQRLMRRRVSTSSSRRRVTSIRRLNTLIGSATKRRPCSS
jgi:hypothetical protein